MLLNIKDFDDDQKSFVCTLLSISGYKLDEKLYHDYVQHSSIDILDAFESMSFEQQKRAFLVIGETLGYLK